MPPYRNRHLRAFLDKALQIAYNIKGVRPEPGLLLLRPPTPAPFGKTRIAPICALFFEEAKGEIGSICDNPAIGTDPAAAHVGGVQNTTNGHADTGANPTTLHGYTGTNITAADGYTGGNDRP